ncbi:MAG: hypothetical protein ABI907_03695 [Ramlibacter sp.]
MTLIAIMIAKPATFFMHPLPEAFESQVEAKALFATLLAGCDPRSRP